MKRFAYLLSVLIIFLTAGNAISDDPTEEWVARYNGSINGTDKAVSMVLDDAGNVYVTGYSDGIGSFNVDYITIKYNNEGLEQWVARYDGPGIVEKDDRASSIALDEDGNVYVTGGSTGIDTFYDYTTIKYNNDGVEEWVAHYDGPGNHMDIATSISLDESGNVYVTGYSFASVAIDRDYATIKYDNDGVEQWVARYNGPANERDQAYSITLDTAGNIYVTGRSKGIGTSYDYATIKYNNDGVEQWAARYDGPANYDDSAESIALDDAGNVYVTGYSNGITSCDYATIKYNSYGVEQWVARYDCPASERDQASSIALDAAGNVYVTGFDNGITSNSNYATIKYNNDGVEQWIANYNGTGNDSDVPSSIALDIAGNVYVTGKSNISGNGNDYATIKYNNDGVEQWVASYNGPGNNSDAPSSIALGSDGNVYITGFSTGSGTSEDFATIKYSQDTGIGETAETPEFSLRVYPCPVSTTASIAVTLPEPSICSVFVYSLDGRLMETLHKGTLPQGEHFFVWQTSQIPVGVYLLRVSAGSMDSVSRLAVIR